MLSSTSDLKIVFWDVESGEKLNALELWVIETCLQPFSFDTM